MASNGVIYVHEHATWHQMAYSCGQLNRSVSRKEWGNPPSLLRRSRPWRARARSRAGVKRRARAQSFGRSSVARRGIERKRGAKQNWKPRVRRRAGTRAPLAPEKAHALLPADEAVFGRSRGSSRSRIDARLLFIVHAIGEAYALWQ